MQINRSNYEIWLIDWLDGNLSDIQVEQLQHFLNENPELKEEFDELFTFRLNPSGKSFPHKNQLKKTISNLSDSQFDYLSVAYLEKDLSADQQTEFKESIELDTEKKMSFELIQKMRLSPVSLPYMHKNRLKRRTVVQNVFRLSLIGLSAAAIITLVVITYLSKPKALQVNFEKTAQAIVADSTIRKLPVKLISNETKTVRKIIASEKQNKILFAALQEKASSLTEPTINPSKKSDSLIRSANFPITLMKKILVSPEIYLQGEKIPNTLIALKETVDVPEYDDGRSKLGKFIAKTFRVKILKEKTAKDSPLKVYEIAEAGVFGLNKLLGWEMALDEKKDEKGEIKSLYFSSKILKFNAPIKKSEHIQ
jgi:hypothetical protein